MEVPSEPHLDDSRLLPTPSDPAQDRQKRLARLQQLLDLLTGYVLTPDLAEGEAELLDLLPEQVGRIVGVEIL